MVDWIHVIEGGLLLVLGGWMTRLQVASARLRDVELRMVKAETRIDAHGTGLEKLQEALDDVREHMARREDVERILQTLGR